MDASINFPNAPTVETKYAHQVGPVNPRKTIQLDFQSCAAHNNPRDYVLLLLLCIGFEAPPVYNIRNFSYPAALCAKLLLLLLFASPRAVSIVSLRRALFFVL